MANALRKSFSPAQLDDERAIIEGILLLGNYVPAAGLPTLPELQQMNVNVFDALEEIRSLEEALEIARARLLAYAQTRHEAIMRTKAQFVASYGRDSTILMTVGLKPMSDYKRATRRSNDPEEAQPAPTPTP